MCVHRLTVLSHCERGCCSFLYFCSTFRLDWSIHQTLTLRHESLSIDRSCVDVATWNEIWNKFLFFSQPSPQTPLLFPSDLIVIDACSHQDTDLKIVAQIRWSSWMKNIRILLKPSLSSDSHSIEDRQRKERRTIRERTEWKHPKAWSTTQSESSWLELNVLMAWGEFFGRKKEERSIEDHCSVCLNVVRERTISRDHSEYDEPTSVFSKDRSRPDSNISFDISRLLNRSLSPLQRLEVRHR